MNVEISAERVELIAAEALLVPVDGQLCKLGGAIAGALRAALPDDDRDDELEYVEHELSMMRPLPHPMARAFDGVARWQKLVVSAAYPHDVDDLTFSPEACANMIRVALPQAIALAEHIGLASLAATLIGTAYRMPVELAVRAFADGLAASRKHAITLYWSIPDAVTRELAAAACARLGL